VVILFVAETDGGNAVSCWMLVSVLYRVKKSLMLRTCRSVCLWPDRLSATTLFVGCNEMYGSTVQEVVDLAWVSWKPAEWQSCFIEGRKCIASLLSIFLDRYEWNTVKEVYI